MNRDVVAAILCAAVVVALVWIAKTVPGGQAPNPSPGYAFRPKTLECISSEHGGCNAVRSVDK